MNDKFDELTKNLAQSVTRRAALKKFGGGLAGMALACFGMASKAKADRKPGGSCLPSGVVCQSNGDCCSHNCVRPGKSGFSFRICV